jgi:hypothetical protein
MESYRLIVLGRGGTEVLLVRNAESFMLPSVEVPRWQRVAENLNSAIKTEWGADIVCLFEMATNSADSAAITRYYAAEQRSNLRSLRKPACCVSLSALRQDLFNDVRDYNGIKQVVASCIGEIERTGAGPFARLGWFRDVSDWINSVIEPMGFHLTGEFRQLNASPTFSLVRFETDGRALWFKAVGEPNQKEFGITCTLARLFPQRVATVLATRSEWNAWITREAEGELLSDSRGYMPWQKVAVDLAELQIDSCGQAQGILAAGVRDLTLGSLSTQIKPLVDAAQQLMDQQIKTPPPILGRKQLLLLADRIHAAIDALQPLGIPEALGHLDFNPGNVIVSDTGCTFLDWAEAYVGNPFLTFQYLLEHFRRTGRNDANWQSELTESYVAPWLRILSREAIYSALAVAPLLAVFSYATATQMLTDKQRFEDAQFAGYARSLVRRMDREARAWADRGKRCTAQITVSRP